MGNLGWPEISLAPPALGPVSFTAPLELESGGDATMAMYRSANDVLRHIIERHDSVGVQRLSPSRPIEST